MKKFKEKCLSLMRSEKTMGTVMTALIIGAVIALNVIVYALTVGYGLYYTPTGELDMSISNASDGKFSSYKGEGVDVIFCRASSTFDDEGGTQDQTFYFHKTAKEFEKRYPGLINLKYINILTKRMEPDNKIVDLGKYQKDESGEVAYPLYESSIIFENVETGKHRVVTDAAAAAFYAGDDTSESYQAYVGEEVFSSMLSWVLAKDTKKAYFTTYHGESSEVYFASMLACAGYEFDIIDLRKQNIPDDADLVVISNPTQDFEASANVEGAPVAEIGRLSTYLANGGSLYVSLDPYAKKLTNLEQLLSNYGISYIETEKNERIFKNIVRDSNDSTSTDNFTLLASFADTKHATDIENTLKTYKSGSVRLRECAALKVEGNAEAILLTSSSSATYANGERTDRSGSYCVGAVAPTKNTSGTKYGNIFVIPSVYLTASDSLMTKGCANRDFIYSVFDFVFDANNAPYGCTPIHFNNETLENLTMGTARIYTAFILAIPAAIAVVGFIVVRRRKNR